MDETTKFRTPPPVPLDLILWLEEEFPLSPPGLSTPDREIWFEAGRQGLIEFLKNIYEEQSEPQL